jgi:hypothetical protein
MQLDDLSSNAMIKLATKPNAKSELNMLGTLNAAVFLITILNNVTDFSQSRSLTLGRERTTAVK